MTQNNEQERWEAELQFEIMEDYLNTAQRGWPDKSREEWLEEMRRHFDKLKSFIAKELKATEERVRGEEREKYDNDMEKLLAGMQSLRDASKQMLQDVKDARESFAKNTNL